MDNIETKKLDKQAFHAFSYRELSIPDLRALLRSCSPLPKDLPILKSGTAKQYCSNSTALSPGAKDKWVYKTKHKQARQHIALMFHIRGYLSQRRKLLVIYVNIKRVQFQNGLTSTSI